jgi:hypothetical protein
MPGIDDTVPEGEHHMNMSTRRSDFHSAVTRLVENTSPTRQASACTDAFKRETDMLGIDSQAAHGLKILALLPPDWRKDIFALGEVGLESLRRKLDIPVSLLKKGTSAGKEREGKES